MQEVLLQLTAGSAFRPKRPATAPAVREQEGPNAALHDLMESCWHQVRAAGTRCGRSCKHQVMPELLSPGVACLEALPGSATASHVLCPVR